jgi:hypothetical protein
MQALAGKPLVRRAVDGFFGQYARRRRRRLDRQDAARVQQETLLRLVRFSQQTRFGQDHDFATIRSVADYQQRVPLREYEQFWQDYWQPAFPYLSGVSWPEHIPYFALSSGTTSGSTKYIPVSRQMVASNRKAALTTLALFLAAHPHTPLFTGRMFFLGGSTDLTPLASAANRAGHLPPLGGDLSGIANRTAGALLRPYTFPPLELALLRDWEVKMQRLAEQSARLPITVVGGVPSWLLLLFERLRQVTGRERIADIWPTLRIVIHGGTKFDPYRATFESIVGSDTVHFLEVYPASEAYLATEDPRYQLLRLLPDLDNFFELVPVEDLGKDRPARHTIGDVELGVQYAVVLTTCAGLWSYVLGDTVAFEKREPPLLRFTGRTRYFLSAFGEHLISEEVERAIAAAADATGAGVVEFHVGPVFPTTTGTPGHHRYLVEFHQPPADMIRFTEELDAALCRLNEDYQAHRSGNLTMLPPEVCAVRRGGFAEWMRSRGKLGGQHKVPRMDNSGQLTAELSAWFGGNSPRGCATRPAGTD